MTFEYELSPTDQSNFGVMSFTDEFPSQDDLSSLTTLLPVAVRQ